jgi:hypothetical protein
MVTFPQIAFDIVTQLHARHPELANGSETDRRQLTMMMAQTICFHLGSDWGTKSADANRPPSKDGIAFNLGGGIIHIWDWQNGSTREVQVRAGDAPHHPNERQHFIAVNPVNHLDSSIPTPAPPNPPSDDDEVPKELIEMVELLKSIETQNKSIIIRLNDIETRIDHIETQLEKPVNIEIPADEFPNYVGRTKAFGGELVLTPVKK